MRPTVTDPLSLWERARVTAERLGGSLTDGSLVGQIDFRGGAAASPASCVRPRPTVRLRGSPTVWLVLAALVLGVLSRVYTTNSLAGEPTSDEYLYAIHARDIGRGWANGDAVSGSELAAEGRSVAVEAAALSFIFPWDVLTLGRTTQALMNALCIPAVLLLGRQVGLSRGAAMCAALLLLAAPEFQESAWRFWTDSQATLLTLLYLMALLAWLRRPGLASAATGVVSLMLLVLTKESTAVTLAPFAVVSAMAALARRWPSSRGARVAVVAASLVALAALALVVRGVPADLARVPYLQRTFGSAPLILASVQDAVPRLPGYPELLAGLLGGSTLGVGLLWATALGAGWLVLQAAAATAGGRHTLGWATGWVLVAVAWLPTMLVLRSGLQAVGGGDPWLALGAALLAVGVGTTLRAFAGERPAPWAWLLLGLVVAAFFSERLVIAATPKVSNAALTFRSFMPIVPLLALIGGAGVWAAVGALRLFAPTGHWGQALPALLVALLLVAVWSPVLRERATATPMLGRVADRGADPDTPQGLRVVALVEAEGWLKANVLPTDVVITGIPRHLTWYADLGVEGMNRLVDLNSQPRTNEERRQYMRPRIGPTGAAYVVDFNVNWLDPGGTESRQWQETYRWLASQPGLETAYLRRDKFGNPVFYVMRNHGYADSYGYRDREQSRLEESSLRSRR